MFSARSRATARRTARPRLRTLLGIGAVATSLTATAVAVGVTGTGATQAFEAGRSLSTTSAGAGSIAAVARLDLDRLERSRTPQVSRSAKRVVLQPQASGHKFATAALNVWEHPREQGRKVGLVAAGSKVAVTGQVVGHWAEVLVKKRTVRWVNADYLANKKPRPAASASGASSSSTASSGAASSSTPASGISTAPCADGSGTESGLTSSAVTLYRAVCAAFPALTTYGGYDPHGEHVDGRAIDFMISDSGLGQAVADWVHANAGALNVRDIIWAQHIWTPEQASSGWRPMSDRGSATANHYDHVHVAVF